MANAKAQHELVGVLVNLYPRLAVRLAEVTGEACPPHERVLAGPNTHQVRKAGKRGQVASDGTVHLLWDEKKCHFFQVEMQRDYKWSKLATLRAYHGSEVRNAECGGHIFVLSPKTSVADSFRKAEEEARARLAFSASYLTGRDLQPLAADGRPFEERALAAAITDFSRGITAGTVPMLLEMHEHSETVADLFLMAILEECPDESELGDALSELAMRRLESLPSFQRWAAQTAQRIEREATERIEREATERIEREATERIEREAAKRVEREVAVAQTKTVIQSLQDYFTAKGDVPTLSALKLMRACTDLTVAQFWLKRAYAGETASQIFPNTPGNPAK
jgi:hypothetical protein